MSWEQTPVYKIKISGLPETGEMLSKSDFPKGKKQKKGEKPVDIAQSQATPIYEIPFSPKVDTVLV